VIYAQRGNTRLLRALQALCVRVVADDNADLCRQFATGTGIDEGLQISAAP
jgi:hypothetical protein